MSQIRELVFATNNAHKLQEIRNIVGDKYKILSLRDINCHEDIAETAETLEGNAEIKARYVKEHYGYDCFADDTSLEVDALGGAPGVYSARYAGEEHDSARNMALLLRNMEGEENRKARFRTVIALILGDELTLMDGIVEGMITKEPSGEEGFGYDPVFMPENCNETFAMMSQEQKNSMSHRGRATAKLIDYLNRL